MARMRSAYARTFFSGIEVTATLEDQATSITYTDPDSGESDTIAIAMTDTSGRWLGSWMPSKGDQIRAAFGVRNWTGDGDNRELNAGLFILDSYGGSCSPGGDTVNIGGVSQPADQGFTSEKRSKTWKNVTVAEIEAEIASRYGLAAVYDAKTIKVKAKTQSKQTDSEFLAAIAKDYGLALKVYSEKLVLFDRNEYMTRAPVAAIDKSQMLSCSPQVELTGTYTGARVAYTDPTTEKTVSYTYGREGRLLKVNKTCDSPAEAQLMARSALFAANHGDMTVSFSLPGNPSICASQVLLLTGIGQFSGRYYIDKITHTLSGSGYTCQYECSNVNNDNSDGESASSGSGSGSGGSSTRRSRAEGALAGSGHTYNAPGSGGGANRNMTPQVN